MSNKEFDVKQQSISRFRNMSTYLVEMASASGGKNAVVVPGVKLPLGCPTTTISEVSWHAAIVLVKASAKVGIAIDTVVSDGLVDFLDDFAGLQATLATRAAKTVRALAYFILEIGSRVAVLDEL